MEVTTDRETGQHNVSTAESSVADQVRIGSSASENSPPLVVSSWDIFILLCGMRTFSREFGYCTASTIASFMKIN